MGGGGGGMRERSRGGAFWSRFGLQLKNRGIAREKPAKIFARPSPRPSVTKRCILGKRIVVAIFQLCRPHVHVNALFSLGLKQNRQQNRLTTDLKH